MPVSSTKFLIYQTIFPTYRAPLFAALRGHYGPQLELCCGNQSFSATLTTDPATDSIRVELTNKFLIGKRLLWQSGLVARALSPEVVIGEFNLRSVSTWLVVVLRALLGKVTVLWGHASGRGRYSWPLRNALLSAISGFIAYTPAERLRVLSVNRKLDVTVGFNATLWRDQCWSYAADSAHPLSFLYVGRLVPEKKVSLLLTAFTHCLRRGSLGSNCELIFVGAGPSGNELRKCAGENSELARRVKLLGPISDVDRLRHLYSNAIASVSPGPVGLAATQSFAFGVPIIVALGEQHGPEVDTCIHGFNAGYFKADSVEDLAAKLEAFYLNREMWISSRGRVSSWLSSTYAFDEMIKGFKDQFDSQLQPADRVVI